MGCFMKSAVAAQGQPEECFILQMDGKAKSQHRRFVDALRAGLQLRDHIRSTTSKCGRCRRAAEELVCTHSGKVSG